MRELAFFRHGQTAGNREGRYVGRTDEGLCPEGREALGDALPPDVDFLYISPMRRCQETAAILYPDLTPTAVLNFRECDFGAFEYKTHVELAADPQYQIWIDSDGSLPFPSGEGRDAFRARCCTAFSALLADPRSDEKRLALVIHGGTIMAILEKFALPRRDYFDYQVKNGRGYLCCEQDGVLQILTRF